MSDLKPVQAIQSNYKVTAHCSTVKERYMSSWVFLIQEEGKWLLIRLQPQSIFSSALVCAMMTWDECMWRHEWR